MTEETSLPFNQSQSLEIIRVAIQEALTKYIKIAYPAEQSAAGVFTKDEQITIVISGEKTNLRNFWSGRWTSSWNLSINDGSAELTGDLKVNLIRLCIITFSIIFHPFDLSAFFLNREHTQMADFNVIWSQTYSYTSTTSRMAIFNYKEVRAFLRQLFPILLKLNWVKRSLLQFRYSNREYNGFNFCLARNICSSLLKFLFVLYFNHIKAYENTLQSSLEEMYTSMNEETLKAMRRIMPITRTKMEWNVNAVRMVRQVRK